MLRGPKAPELVVGDRPRGFVTPPLSLARHQKVPPQAVPEGSSVERLSSEIRGTSHSRAGAGGLSSEQRPEVSARQFGQVLWFVLGTGVPELAAGARPQGHCPNSTPYPAQRCHPRAIPEVSHPVGLLSLVPPPEGRSRTHGRSRLTTGPDRAELCPQLCCPGSPCPSHGGREIGFPGSSPWSSKWRFRFTEGGGQIVWQGGLGRHGPTGFRQAQPRY